MRNHHWNASRETSSRVSGAEKSGRLADPAQDRRQQEDQSGRSQGQSREQGAAPRAAGQRLFLARQQEAGRGFPDFSQGQQDAEESGSHPGAGPHEKGCRFHVKGQPRGAHRRDPAGSQAPHHQPAVGGRSRQARHTPGDGQNQAFGCKDAPDERIRNPQGLEQADLAEPLLQPQLEEKDRQEQGGDDQEEAEVEEVLTEVGAPA